MSPDPLQQYNSVRQKLLAERAKLLQRLRTIDEALASDRSSRSRRSAAKSAAAGSDKRTSQPEEFITQREAITQALRENGPLTRQELAKAIQELGYVSKAKDPLNSMGIVLYAKNSPIHKKDGKFYLRGHSKPRNLAGR